jgi:hypothetical protein
MGGSVLWSQFGGALDCNNVRRLADTDMPFIWASLRTAADATKAVMKKAPAPQLVAALEAIDTMKEQPDLEDGEDGEDSKRTAEPTHINLFMWLRIMLRQFQEDVNTRLAALRLMFESASVGALTPQPHSQLPSESQQQGRVVEYPQFQAICNALFPNLPTTDVAALFAKCYEQGKKKVTANVFAAVADECQCFSKALQLEALPLLTPEDFLSPLRPPSGQVREATTTEVVAMRRTRVKNSVSLAGAVKPFENQLATKIYSLVHRKLAVLTPELRQVTLLLPERWRTLLKTAKERVQVALNESLGRILRRQKAGTLEGPKAQDPNVNYVDGLQPFLEYKRLLALMLLLKSYTENPYLPNDLFAGDSAASRSKPNLCRAERLVTHLEDAIFICGGESSVLQKSFERARLTIVVRRLQAAYRAHKKRGAPK